MHESSAKDGAAYTGERVEAEWTESGRKTQFTREGKALGTIAAVIL
jgi:hypothetical protein